MIWSAVREEAQGFVEQAASHSDECCQRNEGGAEAFSNVHNRQSGCDRVGIVPMNELMEGIQISLSVAPRLPMFRHDCLRFDCNPNCRWWAGDDSARRPTWTELSGRWP
jgi:hypothetical protein